jgi:putative DNA primase/helicase
MIDVRVAEFGAHEPRPSVVPPREDGSKRPDVDSSKEFRSRRPSGAQIGSWYGNGRTRLGVVCGVVSGELEVIDLEGRAVAEGIHDRYRELAEAAGLGDVLSRIRQIWAT